MTGRGRPALVIFDCDGVLVDSERQSHAVLQAMLAEHGVALSFDETVRQFIGSSTEACLARVAALCGGQLPERFWQDFGTRCRAAFEADLTPVPGVVTLLEALALPCCVASNGTHRKVRFTLGHTGLLPRFEGRIFTADDVARPKPAPDLFLLAARTLGATPDTTTVVEDSPTGITAAKAAGMRAIGYAAMTPAERLRGAGADVVVDSMAAVAIELGLKS